MAKAPGLHCDWLDVGPFEEEEEGINTASDLAAPGYIRGDRATRFVGDG